MKFHRVIGKIDPKLVEDARVALSKVFLELALKYGNKHAGSALGGDPFLFTLLQPMQHICTLNINTAATDGKRYYWNPKFVLSKDKIGLRLVCAHEAWHAIYMHPQRRGKRNPKLWNIAVDFIVNGTVMDDIRIKGNDPSDMFRKHLGNFVTLAQYAEHIKNPFVPMPGIENFIPEPEDEDEPKVDLPKADEDRELTEEEKKELEKANKKYKYFYADPNLPSDMKKPEKIYDYLLHLLPKCPKCGRIGMYQIPKEEETSPSKGQQKDLKKDSKKEQDKKEQKKTTETPKQESANNHDHGNNDEHAHGASGEQCDHDGDCDCSPTNQSGDGSGSGDGQGDSCEGQGCSGCGGGYDIFGFGDTLDDHMDANESPEKMAKRLADAIESAKKMAGYVPGEMEDELGLLSAPRIRWQDFIRTKLNKTRQGNAKNDWTRFKIRQLFAGLLNPKRKNNFATFGCLLDTSGSMSKDDMAFGVSQLQSLDERSEGWIVPADATVYWKDAVKLRKVSSSEISQIRVVGRGGTMFAQFFDNYKDEMGDADFLIVITDGYLLDTDIAEMKDPGVDVIWLITSSCSFNAPFGRVFELKSI